MSTSAMIVGKLARTPQIRTTKAGKPVTNLVITDTRHWTNTATGRQEAKTNYYDITVWGNLAHNVVDTLQEGDRVIVYGQLDTESRDATNPCKHNKVYIIAHYVGPDLRWASADLEPNPDHTQNAEVDGYYTEDDQNYSAPTLVL